MSVKIYLCGKCTGLSIEEMTIWRNEIINEFVKRDCNFKIINPCDYYASEEFFNENRISSFRQENTVREFDINAVKHSDIIIVNCENINTSVGSIFEIAIAKEYNIPIVAFNYNNKIHSWIDTCIQEYFNTIEEMIIYIIKYYEYLQ